MAFLGREAGPCTGLATEEMVIPNPYTGLAIA